MENFWRRFPLPIKSILENLDEESLARSKYASREISNVMNESERFMLMRKMKKLRNHFEGYEESWNQVVNKIPIPVLKQLLIESQKYFRITQFRKNKPVPPLFIAVSANNLELAEFILSKTGNKNPSAMQGYTALHDCIYRSNLTMFKVIFEKVEDKNPKDLRGKTPLHMAARDGQLVACRLIMKVIMDKNPSDNDETTPLHEAAFSGHVDVCKLIVKNVKERNPRNKFYQTPRNWAEDWNCQELIELFD